MKDKISFEDAMQKLEEINQKLQKNDCPLDEAIDLYKEGLKLADYCNKKLEAVSAELNKLSQEQKND
ncbi:MAG: exodeoxyribonuclease VII small subunit [Erysipelotrichia bacterium]|nr:exodeoxyribonuclease VII small subunit [Erysipelotrichia bacterium]